VDLYLEKRLELRAVHTTGPLQIETCRTEGVAARWRSPARNSLRARTGLSARAIAELLPENITMPSARPLPVAEMDPPRGWLEWATEVASHLAPAPITMRFLERRAAVVRAGKWVLASSPRLVRIERASPQPGAILAVWGHPQLGEWLTEFARPAPDKGWAPNSGTILPVVLSDGTAGVLMHELLGHMAESDIMVDGSSPLRDMVGATITDTGLQVTDDPTRFDLPGAFDHDDEGVAAAPIQLVRNGRFEHLLCDRVGASRVGGKPGRGRRAIWSCPPVARISNLVITAGDTAPEALEKDLEQGLVVTRLGGATVDPISNRSVLRVERGWEIRNGKRRRPLDPCELTGGVLEILAAVDPRIGSDPAADWRLGWCVKAGLSIPTGSEAPSLLIHHLEVL
jgi:hypothetical protein